MMARSRLAKTMRSLPALLCAFTTCGPWACAPVRRGGKMVEMVDGSMAGRVVGRLDLRVALAPDANEDNPVALSLLLVRDGRAALVLRGLTAAQWFATRETVLRANSGVLDEGLCKFIPGQQVPPLSVPVRPGTTEGFLFVRYRAGGPHRYRFSPNRPMRLELGRQEISLTQEQGSP